MTTDNARRLPLRVAVHYIGCADVAPGGVAVPSRVGPFLEVLAEAVSDVEVVAFEPPQVATTDAGSIEDSVEYVARAANISLVSLGAKGTWRSYLERRRRVARIVESASGDWDVLIFYFLPNRRAHLVYRANRCPRVVSFVVGTTARGATVRPPDLLSRLVRSFTRRSADHQLREVLARSGLVVFNSRELLETTTPRPENTRVVPLSARRRYQRHEAADRFTGPDVNLLVSGRLTADKGVFVALDAFVSVKQQLPGARLHVFGEGSALEPMLARAETLGVRADIVTYGWVPASELFDMYRTMDVFLLPSYGEYESLPRALWEAMAHSVLVVCTAVRGVREVFAHEREVLLVPMKDAPAVADAVLRLAGDGELRRRLLAAAYAKAASTSIDDTVDGILNGIQASWPELGGPSSGGLEG